MASGCPHVKQLQLASDKSFLNPRAWACVECGFTDSVWACLLCSHVSCGRTNSSHALKHFEQSKHPIAVEVNRRHVHCYLCDDYVMTDNQAGDIALVQSLLEQVASQQYSESCSRSGRVIKPAQALFTRSKSRVEEASDHAADKRYTALCHWRFSQLARAFNTWRAVVQASKVMTLSQGRAVVQGEEEGEGEREGPAKHLGKRRRRKILTPGMTGFRNLGNTCYMNAVLQSLSHLFLFRDSFRQLLPKTPPTLSPILEHPPTSSSPSLLPPKSGSAPSSAPHTTHHMAYTRQTTVECFQHITTCPPSLRRRNCGRGMRQRITGGLSGGEGGKPAKSSQDRLGGTDLCLSKEMHALMRVMWSGKWAVVTPHAVLNAVWELTPCFRGYTQHDAHEFLCELLLVLQNELETWPNIPIYPVPLTCDPQPHPLYPDQLLPSLFQGQLLSKVTYESCCHWSSALEPFWNLSLHFPESVHGDRSTKGAISVTLDELLTLFTSVEALEGERFECAKCPGKLQRASKQMMISECPEVLRLHLKRFRWSGRTQHKINAHVDFPLHLDLSPYCSPPPPIIQGVTSPSSAGMAGASPLVKGFTSPSSAGIAGAFPSPLFKGGEAMEFGEVCLFGGRSEAATYRLSSVIMHHGCGFQSGHYTAYCWNSEAESWVHCNDARLSRATSRDVHNSQAYILFYTRLKGTDALDDLDLDEPLTKKQRTAST